MGKKRPQFVNRMITVPDRLKKQMDKYKGEINWSGVACRAFETELAEIKARKDTKAMSQNEQVVERLRKSVEESESVMFEEGKELGAAWARGQAKAIELRRLEHAYDTLRREPRLAFGQYFGDGLCGVNEIADPAIKEDRHLADEMMERAFLFDTIAEDKASDDDFAHGFVEGAMDVWEDVQLKL